MLNHKKINMDTSDSVLLSNIKNFDSKIINGDVISMLSYIDKFKEFDVIIADPPYNIGKDFGNNKTKYRIEEYIEWSNKWLDLCFELLANDGLIYIYGFPEILARIAVKYPIDKQRILVWHYTNKTTPSSTFWQRSYESILCLWKRDRPKLEIEQIREPYTELFKNLNGKKRKGTNGRFGGGKDTAYIVNEKGALPRDVIKIPALAGGAGNTERWFLCRTCDNKVYPPTELNKHVNHNILKHPTQKPMRLTQRLILSKIIGNNGNVLIPFAGSGSECIVAKQLGISYLGIELNPEYVDFANKWLKYYDI